MAELQLDGVPIAEIDQYLAEQLLEAVKAGLGKTTTAEFQSQPPSTGLRKPERRSDPIIISLTFPFRQDQAPVGGLRPYP